MLAILRSLVLTAIAASLALVAGTYLGAALGHWIAWISGRDPAELKDMMIWCMIGTMLISTAGTVWAMTFVLSARRWIKLLAGALFCLVALGSVGIAVTAYLEAPRYGSRR